MTNVLPVKYFNIHSIDSLFSKAYTMLKRKEVDERLMLSKGHAWPTLPLAEEGSFSGKQSNGCSKRAIPAGPAVLICIAYLTIHFAMKLQAVSYLLVWCWYLHWCPCHVLCYILDMSILVHLMAKFLTHVHIYGMSLMMDTIYLLLLRLFLHLPAYTWVGSAYSKKRVNIPHPLSATDLPKLSACDNACISRSSIHTAS